MMTNQNSHGGGGGDPTWSIGGQMFTSIGDKTGKWRKIVILKNNSEFTKLVGKNVEGDLTNTPLGAGLELEGYFTEFAITSNSAVMAYFV